MKKTIRTLAWTLLLALVPAAAPAARILLVNIDPSAKVYVDNADQDSGSVAEYTANGKGVNAARVSVNDGNGGSFTYLAFVYEDEQGSLIIDEDNTTIDLSIDAGSGSGSGSGGGSGGESGSGGGSGTGGANWLSLFIGDRVDRTLTLKLELGNVDWDAYDAAYNEVDPTTWDVPFTGIAYATATLGELEDAKHVAPAGETGTPGQTPWTPDKFTAVPEPATCGMALLGLVLLLKRRKTA